MPHRLDGEYTAHGIALKVDVSPCCWMHPGYPLQVSYRAADGLSWGYVRDKSLSEATAARDDVAAMLEKHLTAEPCEKCGSTHLHNPDGNRGHACEKCFMAALNAEFEKEAAKERAKIAKEDARMKKQGFTHRVEAWVHPPRGDDYQIGFYCKGEPGKAQIEAELKRRRSKILNDYTVTTL